MSSGVESRGAIGALHKESPSFNYSVRSPGFHYNGNHSLLQLMPPPDITKLLTTNVTSQGSLFQNASLELLTNLTACNFGNDTSSIIGCNFSMSHENTGINTTNTTITERVNPYTTLQLAVLALLAGTTIITTIVGNLVVILSFIIERSIRQPTNYFIASLAMSDLLIGTFSMPFYTVYLLTGKYWPLGEVLCDLWLSVDYTVCLTSIYTVFCITIDRFCSVKIPAKYRAWRTDQKVTGVIALTWIIPIFVFFTSIFGWQYFVGKRTVPDGMCYIQYMEDALFNCVLQIGYFWVTLTVMCVLYSGIYKVALDLQRKSEAKQKKMTSLVSMAGQTMTKIGIGMSKHHSSLDSKSLFEKAEPTMKTDCVPKTLDPGHSTTSFNSKQVKDDDRSSSPAFPSDTDQSSQSPKHNNPKKMEGGGNSRTRGRKRPGKMKNANNKKSKRNKDKVNQEEPGLENSAFAEMPDNNNSPVPLVGNSLGNARSPFRAHPVGNNLRSPTSPNATNIPKLPVNSISPKNESHPDNDNMKRSTSYDNYPQNAPLSPSCIDNMPHEPPPPYPEVVQGVHSEVCSPIQNPSSPEEEFTFPPPPASATACDYGGESLLVDDNYEDDPNESDKTTLVNEIHTTGESMMAVASPPEFISGLKYIDQDSLKSPLSTDNIKVFAELGCEAPKEAEAVLVEVANTNTKKPDVLLVEVPDSPIWKRRSLVERETRSGCGRPSVPSIGKHQPTNPQHIQSESNKRRSSSSSSHVQNDSPAANHDTGINNSSSKSGSKSTTGNAQLESHLDENSRTVSRLAKPDEIQPLNAEAGANTGKKKNRQKGGSPLRGLIKSVGSRRFKRSKKEKQQRGKSENRARKALRVITIILGAFVLCWTPWHILSMIIGFCPDNTNCVEPILYDISYWLCYLNSPINPLCYAFANQQFKKTFLRILRFDWHRT